MLKCSFCKKTFEDRQALGNHIKKYLDDSDDDSSFPSQSISQDSFEATTHVLVERNMSDKQNISEKTEDIELFSCTSDSQGSSTTDNESVVSDLSDVTDIDISEYDEYNDLLSGIPKGLEDIYQEFPLEEYAEFLHIIT
ncbi:19992_t:CDS:2 [Racocetra persica]|uniref:19992_t:CDS:1 n=1 Tax=Racocetra persica TaxID=160502 RepID=A0ACA9L9W2_9GLOM|nr:19992_t:CDS:2 [Racocetra persica]